MRILTVYTQVVYNVLPVCCVYTDITDVYTTVPTVRPQVKSLDMRRSNARKPAEGLHRGESGREFGGRI
jgi:hypothetical protein